MSSQVPVDPAADLTTMQFHQHDQIQSTARIDKDVNDRILELRKTCKTPNQDRASPQRRRPLGLRRAEGQATGFASAGLPAWRCRFTSGTRLRRCSSCSLSSSSTSRIPTRFAVKTCTSPLSSRSPSTRRADHRPTHHDEGRRSRSWLHRTPSVSACTVTRPATSSTPDRRWFRHHRCAAQAASNLRVYHEGDKDRVSERKSWVRFLMRSTTPEQLEYFKPVFGRRLGNEGRFRQSSLRPPLTTS